MRVSTVARRSTEAGRTPTEVERVRGSVGEPGDEVAHLILGPAELPPLGGSAAEPGYHGDPVAVFAGNGDAVGGSSHPSIHPSPKAVFECC